MSEYYWFLVSLLFVAVSVPWPESDTKEIKDQVYNY